ncbi:hypothetical protein [Yinghuangia sp. YIM S10712]|uniref:hypothetical protein n=1 Tax=Yinghuangia sp. YIM S10712 TaxID=3436930 RepID=UPI003F5361A8
MVASSNSASALRLIIGTNRWDRYATAMPSPARAPTASASTTSAGAASRSRSPMSPDEITAVIVEVVAISPAASRIPAANWQTSSATSTRRSASQPSRSAFPTRYGSRAAIARVVTFATTASFWYRLCPTAA